MELVQRIQAGETELLPELWEKIAKLAKWLANKRMPSAPAWLEFDDLYQCGYPAMCEAVKTYDCSSGAGFANWFGYYFKTEIANLTGTRTARQRKEPLNTAASLDAPLPTDEELSLYDAIPDNADDMGAVEDAIYTQQLHDALEEALAALTEQQRLVIRDRYYKGMTRKEAAETVGVQAERARQIENQGFRRLRSCKYTANLQKFIDMRTPWYLSVGPAAFNRTNTSAVERIALIRERLLEWATG